jgi:hypothetical protein
VIGSQLSGRARASGAGAAEARAAKEKIHALKEVENFMLVDCVTVDWRLLALTRIHKFCSAVKNRIGRHLPTHAY